MPGDGGFRSLAEGGLAAVPGTKGDETAEPVSELEAACKDVFRSSLKVDGCQRGLRQVVQGLERDITQVVFLVDSCEEKKYKEVVNALCKEKNVPVITIPTREKLGEWARLCEFKKDGTAKNIVKTSCASITDFGQDENAAQRFMLKIQGGGEPPPVEAEAAASLSAMGPQANRMDSFIPSLFALAFVMLALVGLKKFRKSRKPSQGLHDSLMSA
jgi:small subunit ribosomal protein S12e